jgi:hypothetical protein
MKGRLFVHEVARVNQSGQRGQALAHCRDGGEIDVGLAVDLDSQDIRLPANQASIPICKTG